MKALAILAALALLSPATSTAGADAHGTGSCAPGRTLLFCEDFEHLPTGGASSMEWGIDTRNGTLTVERQPRGDKVLHARTRDNGRAFLTVHDLAVPGDRLYGRMRVRVAAFPTAPDWAHFTLVEATGTGSAEMVRPLGGQWVPPAGRALWGIGADGGPTGDWTAWQESAPAEAGRWQCVEWLLDRDGNRVLVWLGDPGAPTLSASERSHGGADVPFVLPDVTTVKVGWQLYQSGTTPAGFDVWIDDIALAPHRLGCAPQTP
ncbi:hypothetical protein J2S43_002685 [Catenuloplanes nepalensis]|uniref:Uncharacterized protein n=1 Tax=Catenuloplanes nepalensis TaxID=587533 RepID=A0ABT9MS03_9ACTN|nr:hypothetical protein [Catenuloplanes nepalensis]MDP9794173.1 hypothetical protein [Catenuloplanes nepalensis]